MSRQGLVDCDENIGPVEISAFEKKRLAGVLSERVGKAVAEVESGWVAPLSETAECVASGFQLGKICRDHRDS